ncbi:MAG TPA: GlsB/YeaQ/YmgE family stress response membrane protein [Candidatus Limnocylindrales bacterium]|nr:GlsB/YeaQ/YmgE family stress response membrane protein [Candidatus Limnocylindrales bacterium]
MDLGFFGWIIVGLIAGSVSGWFVGTRTAQGCLPTIIVGVIGGVIGGWLSGLMGFGRVEGLIGALVFATIGSILVRLILRAIEGRD